MRSIGAIVYVVIGVVVASTHHYLGTIDGLGDIVNLLLAIILWPLVLLGVDFNLHLGGGKDRNGALLSLGPPMAFARSAFGSTRRRHRT